jgi:DNA-binding response OmpR family regulator
LPSLPSSPRACASVYDGGKERQNRSITRPKVLLVVGHPSIGTALETLLRIEDRYEVRRAQSLEQVVAGVDGWNADLALVDGVLAQNGRTEALMVPVIVLSGNAADGKRLLPRFVNTRGWLRKDATPEELHAAIDHALERPVIALPRPRAIGIALAAVLVLVLLVATWYLLGGRV